MSYGVFRRHPWWGMFPSLRRVAMASAAALAVQSGPNVAIDTTASGNNYNSGSGAVTVTVPMTLAAKPNRYLRVYIGVTCNGTANIATCTWGGVALSPVITVVGSTDQKFFVYELVAPASGSANLVVTSTATAQTAASVAAVAAYNVNQASPTITAPETKTQGSGAFISAGCISQKRGLAIGGVFGVWAGGPRSITARNGVPYFVSSGALSAAALVNSIAPSLPNGLQIGDVEIATCASENNETHVWSGGGWTKGGQTHSGSGWTVSWGWKVYEGDSTGPTITWTNPVDASARRRIYRDNKSASPVAAIGTPGTGTAATHTSTGGTTAQALSLALYNDHAKANTAIATPSGWTEDEDSGSATGPTRTAAGHKDMIVAGATGDISITGAAAAWVQQQLELLCSMGGAQSALVANNYDNFDGSDDQAVHVMSESPDTYNSMGWAISSYLSAQIAVDCLRAA